MVEIKKTDLKKLDNWLTKANEVINQIVKTHH